MNASIRGGTEFSIVRCLNPKCRHPLPGHPLMMNSLELKEIREPIAGDIAICAACGRIMIFLGYGYSVRDPSREEAKLIGANKEVMEIRDAIIQRLVKNPEM